MEDLERSFSDFQRSARDRLSAVTPGASLRRRHSPTPANNYDRGSAHTAKRPTISTGSAQPSGSASKSPGRRRPRKPATSSFQRPPASSSGTADGLSSRGTCQQQPDTRWQQQLSAWEDIAKRFHIDPSRYAEFEYLKYLDIECPYVANYVDFHLGINAPLIKGRLAQHINYWKSLNSPNWLLDVIEFGFKIPFEKMPPRILLPNNRSVLHPEKLDWVRTTIIEYLHWGFIRKVDTVPYCVSPLQVKDTGNKTALIFDMSMVNQYVEKSHFKMEGWEEMFEYSKNASFGVKFDIKKYFYCIDIHPDHQKYFGFMFCMAEDSKPTMFTWTVLPYGYTRAPFLARELMKPLISKWRSLLINIVVFCDDGMAVSETFSKMSTDSLQIQCDLLRAGLVPGIDKCIWTPQNVIEWNGLKFDFSLKRISILDKRISSTNQAITQLLSAWPLVTFREVSRVVGKILSMHPVFNGREQLFTRMSQTIVNIRFYKNLAWDDMLSVDFPPLLDSAKQELNRWPGYFVKYNYRTFNNVVPTFAAWTDASAFAIAGLIVKIDQDEHFCLNAANKLFCHAGLASRAVENCVASYVSKFPRTVQPQINISSVCDLLDTRLHNVTIVHRQLFSFEIATDSNERELLAIVELFDNCKNLLSNTRVVVHIDNENAALICKKGSPKHRLQRHAERIYHICDNFNIMFEPVWIPRDLNKAADSLSKMVDFEDYSVTRVFFDTVCKDAPFTPVIDCFANESNAKLPLFFSPTYSKLTAGVDCFRYDWQLYRSCWLFPPPRLIMKCYNYLKACQVKGLLLTPQWKNRAFYTLLRNTPDCFLKRMLIYDGTCVFRQGSDADSYFGPNYKGNVM